MLRLMAHGTVAIISDIHGNLHALQASLEDAAAHEVESIWCLGDVRPDFKSDFRNIYLTQQVMLNFRDFDSFLAFATTE